MESLCAENIYEIACYLNVKEILNFSLCSKFLYQELKSNEHFWQILYGELKRSRPNLPLDQFIRDYTKIELPVLNRFYKLMKIKNLDGKELHASDLLEHQETLNVRTSSPSYILTGNVITL